MRLLKGIDRVLKTHPAWARDVNGHNLLMFIALAFVVTALPRLAVAPVGSEPLRHAALIALWLYCGVVGLFFALRISYDIWLYSLAVKLANRTLSFDAAMRWPSFADELALQNPAAHSWLRRGYKLAIAEKQRLALEFLRFLQGNWSPGLAGEIWLTLGSLLVPFKLFDLAAQRHRRR